MEGGKREGRRAELRLLQVPLGRGLEEKRAYGRQRHQPAPGVQGHPHPQRVPRLSGDSEGGPEVSRPACFPTVGLHHPGPDRLTPGVATAGDSAPAQQGACPPPPRSSPLAAPRASASADSHSLSPGTGVWSQTRRRLPERSLIQPTHTGGHGRHPRPGQGLHSGGAASRLHRSLR